MKRSGESKKGFTFESFGVSISIGSNDERSVAEIENRLPGAFGDTYSLSAVRDTEHSFDLHREGNSQCTLLKNGDPFLNKASLDATLGRLLSELRITVAEYAVDRVFVHAGAVSWRGKGIIIPARSFRGKSTLTAALVRAGARYFSDEYAVLDARGRLHPFPKDLSLRGARDKYEQDDHTVASLGGKAGKRPVPVGVVVITEYEENAKWRPEVLTSGAAVLEIMKNTVPIRREPEFALTVLTTVARRALCVSSNRGDADIVVPLILELAEGNLERLSRDIGKPNRQKREHRR